MEQIYNVTQTIGNNGTVHKYTQTHTCWIWCRPRVKAVRCITPTKAKNSGGTERRLDQHSRYQEDHSPAAACPQHQHISALPQGEGRAGLSGGGRIEPFHLGTCSSSTTTCVCPGRGGFQMALWRPWKALWEGQTVHRVIPDESEQKIPCTKGASRTLFCDHMTIYFRSYIHLGVYLVYLHVCLVV